MWWRTESGERAIAPNRDRALIWISAVIGGMPAIRRTASVAVLSGIDSSRPRVARLYLSRAARWDFFRTWDSRP